MKTIELTGRRYTGCQVNMHDDYRLVPLGDLYKATQPIQPVSRRPHYAPVIEGVPPMRGEGRIRLQYIVEPAQPRRRDYRPLLALVVPLLCMLAWALWTGRV
jgi:hypothetical protein